MSLAHMHLMVGDLQRSVDFYVKYLGFYYAGRQTIEKARYITEHWMEAGTEIAFVRDKQGGEIALELATHVDRLPPWFHFGFLLPSSDAVVALHRRFTEQGVRTRKLSFEGECVGFRAYDPDGYLLEFCHEPGRGRDAGMPAASRVDAHV